MGVGDKGSTCKIGVEALHDAAVVKAVLDLLMMGSPELLLML